MLPEARKQGHRQVSSIGDTWISFTVRAALLEAALSNLIVFERKGGKCVEAQSNQLGRIVCFMGGGGAQP